MYKEKSVAGSISKTLICCILASLTLFYFLSCSDGWAGYMDTDLSKYVSLGQYKGLTYTSISTEVTDEEVDAEINRKLEENKYTEKVTGRAVENGDSITITYYCSVDDTVVPGLGEEKASYTVGAEGYDKYISGMLTSLIGKTPGETEYYETLFSEDYQNDRLDDASVVAGKTVKYRINILYITEEIIPVLTDELVKNVLSDTSETVEEYREEIFASLKAEKEADALKRKQEDVWSKAVENAEIISYPKDELKKYKDEMYDNYEYYASYYKLSLEEFLSTVYDKTPGQFEEEATKYAENSVRELLVFYAIAKAENITLNDDEYAAGAQKIVDDSGGEFTSIGELEAYYGVEVVEESILFNKVTDYVCDNAVEE